MNLNRRISQAEYDTHDCHASADDGCAACESWKAQCMEDDRVITTSMKTIVTV